MMARFCGGPADGRLIGVEDSLDRMRLVGGNPFSDHLYLRHRWGEEVYPFRREVSIFVLSGLKPETFHTAAKREIEAVAWDLAPQPSILKDFRRWWIWTLCQLGVECAETRPILWRVKYRPCEVGEAGEDNEP